MNVITISNVSKEFKKGIGDKKVRALEDLNLEIHQGEVFGFLGPNGAGKSTTMKIILNFIYPDRGSVSVLGKNVNDKEVRRFVGYLPETPYFYDYLTAEEILMFGAEVSGLSKKETVERSETLLNKVNLWHSRKRPLRSYSKGMLQRVGLALALIHNPEVVILDEPMSGLDPIGRKMVGDLILELKAQNKTVFFCSHILSDVERFCDRVGIIVGGRLKSVDELHTLLRKTTLEDVFLEQVRAAGGGIEA